MFDWFKKKEKSNVIPFPESRGLPEPDEYPQMPEVVEKDNTPCYQVGKTEDGRVTLRLGDSYSYSQLTMNDEGVDCLIAMLEAAKGDNE